MNTLDFFQRVLPKTGTYCAFGAMTGGRVKQVFSTTLAELEQECLKLDQQGFNAYQAMATFQTSQRRTQDNVAYLKSFYLDIDCKDPSTQYQNWKYALQALLSFLDDTGLPKPIVVRSGGGLHVYWSLIEEIAADVWLPIAEALKNLCLSKGLKIDKVITADSARVLRTPNTTHTPTGRIVTVLMDAPSVALEDIIKLLHVPGAPVAPKAQAKYGLIDNLQVKNLPPANSQVLEQKCGQVAWATSNQGDISEPTWYALMGIASYCHDPEVTAVRWSDQHPGYDYNETIKKLGQWKVHATGPATCARLAAEKPSLCNGCKYKGSITTPVQIGAQHTAIAAPVGVADPTAATPIPAPFKRTAGGIVMTIDDTDIELCPFDIYPISYGYDEHLGYEIVRFKWKRSHTGWKEILFRQAYLVDGAYREFSGVIADQGIVLYNRKKTEIFQLMLRLYMDELRKLQSVTNHYTSMGWKADNKEFLLGDCLFKLDDQNNVIEEDVSLSAGSSRQVERSFGQHGDYDKWRKVTKVLGDGQLPAHALALCVSFSSVLYNFTGLKGITLSLYGPTGSGKTLAQKWMQSVWGNPEQLHFGAKFTQNSLFNRLGVHCHLPMTVDEATMMADKDVGEFIYWVSQGKDKARLTKTITERDPKSWATVVTLSTNRSIASKLAATGLETSAQMVRLLELQLPESSVFSGESKAGAQIYDLIHDNYGHAGKEFIRRLMELGPEKTRAMVKNAPRALEKKFNTRFSGQERFWEQLLSLAYVAGVLAKTWKIIDFEPDAAINWALSQVDSARSTVKENERSGFDAVADYLNEFSGQAVTVMNTMGQKAAVDITRLPRNDIRIRYDVYRTTAAHPFDRGTVLLDSVHFRHWASTNNYDYRSIINEIRNAGADATPRTRKAMLTKDTGIKGAQIYVFGIKMNHPMFEGVFDTAEQNADSLTYGKLSVIPGNKRGP